MCLFFIPRVWNVPSLKYYVNKPDVFLPGIRCTGCTSPKYTNLMYSYLARVLNAPDVHFPYLK
jgi:cytochrome c2